MKFLTASEQSEAVFMILIEIIAQIRILHIPFIFQYKIENVITSALCAGIKCLIIE